MPIEPDVNHKLDDAAQAGGVEGLHPVADAAPILLGMTGPDRACRWVNQEWLEFVGSTMAKEVGDG